MGERCGDMGREYHGIKSCPPLEGNLMMAPTLAHTDS